MPVVPPKLLLCIPVECRLLGSDCCLGTAPGPAPAPAAAAAAAAAAPAPAPAATAPGPDGPTATAPASEHKAPSSYRYERWVQY